MDYTSGYLELKECREEFLPDSAKVHIDLFQSNPEFIRRVKHLLHPKKLTVMVIGGALKRGENCYYNIKGWKLLSETQFVDVTELPGDLLIRGPSICHFDLNRLILTGGSSTNVCAMFDMSTKKGTKMTNLKRMRTSHASGASCSNS